LTKPVAVNTGLALPRSLWKVKVGFLYSAAYTITGPARFTISEMTADRQ